MVQTWNIEAWRRHLPAGASFAPADLLVGDTLPRSWRSCWAKEPAGIALTDLTDATKSFTRLELSRTTATLAAALHARGLRPGHTVLMNAASSTHFILLYVAVLRLGAIVVPANTAYRERELGNIVRDCRISMAIVDDAERAHWIQRASARGKALPIIHPLAPELMFAEALPPDHLDAAAADDAALIVYTSGTTGTPKGACLTHGNLLAVSRSLDMAWRLNVTDGLVLALPLFHVHGLAVSINTCLLTGTKILLLPRFDAVAVLTACRRPDATLLYGVPTMWVRLADTIAENPEHGTALGALRLLVSGSAPLAPTIFEKVKRCCGQAILERYGMSETITLISNPYEGERRPGTVGLPLPGVELRVITRGQEAGVGEIGEIEVRGPNVFRGYWDNEEGTRQAFEPDGWFHTHDLGFRDADDYITLVGRATDLIITGGYNVYPREIEEVLLEHPDVNESAVIGMPSREWGEEVVALIVSNTLEAASGAAILADWCRDRLAKYKHPRRFIFVGKLPRNALGKVLRGDLQKEIAQWDTASTM